MALAALVALAGVILYVDDVKAGQVSKSDMAGIVGKACCSGVKLLWVCQSSGVECNACGSCTGFYITGGNVLFGCGQGGQGTCTDYKVACTRTVFCNVDYVSESMWCWGSECEAQEGYECPVCKQTDKANDNYTQTCG